MNLVIDASVTLGWFFQDERTEAGNRLLDQVTARGATVPSLWPFEVGNGLLMSYRRNRITKNDLAAAFEALLALNITVDRMEREQIYSRLLGLAQEHRLTFYDAAYLELAMRLNGSLCTSDHELLEAAQRAGVAVWNGA